VRDAGLAERVTTAFVAASRAGLAESRVILEHLRRRVALGVVSNFYGNVGRLLEEANIAPLLASIIDSTRVGVSKPDPEIFALAVRQIGCDPGNTLYVGDSFEKDVVGAHAAGLRTAWLVGMASVPVRLRSSSMCGCVASQTWRRLCSEGSHHRRRAG
jgi:HAD superfamily hydrolase (TIGR01549 family)